MSVQLSLHFRSGLRVIRGEVHPSKDFATLTLGEVGDDAQDPRSPHPLYATHPVLFFQSVSDIERLTAALQSLGIELAAAQAPDVLKARACDPHSCVRCHRVDCVCGGEG